MIVIIILLATAQVACITAMIFLQNNFSLRSSRIRSSYIHNFIIILSRVYNEPIQRPAPSWLVSLIGRALHRYRRGQGFESRTSLNFFQAFFSQLHKLRIHLFQLRLLPWTMFHSLQCTMVNPFVAGSLVLFKFIEIMETICEKAFKRAFKSNGC